MSHVASVDLHVTDLDALEKSCKNIGLELVRGQQTYKWYGHSVGDYPLPDNFTEQDLGHCESAIRIPGNEAAYEIGVVRRRDGQDGYQLLWDFYNGGYGMESMVGQNAEKLKQHYGIEVAKSHLYSLGYELYTETKTDGTIDVVAQVNQ